MRRDVTGEIDYQQIVDLYGLPPDEALEPNSVVNPRILERVTLAEALQEFKKLPPDRRLAVMISLPNELLLSGQIADICNREDCPRN